MSKLLFDDTHLAVHTRPTTRRHAAGPRPALPPARGDPAGRAVEAHHGRPGAHGRPARPVARPSTRPRPASLGYSFTDPENVEFWWERGAETAWQTVPAHARHARPVRPVGVGLLQAVQAHRRPHRRRPQRGAGRSRSSSTRCLGFALLTAVDTYTYRSDSVMLSTAQSYRPGTCERAAPHLAGDARRERDRLHDAPEERAAVGHAVARRRRLLDRQRQPAARRAARRAVDEPLRAEVREPRSAARPRSTTSIHPRVLPAGAVRRGRAAGGLDVRAEGRRATSRCTRGGPRTGARTTTRRSSRTG